MKKQVAYIKWLQSLPKIGERGILYLANGDTVSTSKIISMGDNYIETKNTIYVKIEEGDNFVDVEDDSGELVQPNVPPVNQTVPTMQVQQPQNVIQSYPQYPQEQQNYPQEQQEEQVAPQQQIYQETIQQSQPIPQPIQPPIPQPIQPKIKIHQQQKNEQSGYVSDKVGLNKADYNTRLKVAKSLKIIKDVDSDKPGT